MRSTKRPVFSSPAGSAGLLDGVEADGEAVDEDGKGEVEEDVEGDVEEDVAGDVEEDGLELGSLGMADLVLGG
ncbi:hypothetical protein [Roseateles violae]|uniref:Uncharacterized protein n=1 Tax=Roseateles violae TaxID=3058042 RepID=A0ABT8DU68_9BURK|nr:hypothetical protein [Pelomonas sp. PFR6]MDN3921543.1 hypothetical protein [Pelomonas sp. PFR6]